MARYIRYNENALTQYGEIDGDVVRPMDGEFGEFRRSSRTPTKLSDVVLLAPCLPSKIVAIGPNFAAHLNGQDPPLQPMFWLKPSTALNNPEGVIEIPVAHPRINHECELAVVIGKTARCITPDEATKHIFGYTCMNDVTAGDLSTSTSFVSTHYFVDGKIFDTFAPLGPHIETELNTDNLFLECRINGKTRQRHSTSDFIFTPAAVVAMASQIVTLLPGDVISMGSPPGVGPMSDGDTVEVEVEGIGVLRNFVRARR